MHLYIFAWKNYHITQFFLKLLSTDDSNLQNPLFNTIFQNCKKNSLWQRSNKVSKIVSTQDKTFLKMIQVFKASDLDLNLLTFPYALV